MKLCWHFSIFYLCLWLDAYFVSSHHAVASLILSHAALCSLYLNHSIISIFLRKIFFLPSNLGKLHEDAAEQRRISKCLIRVQSLLEVGELVPMNTSICIQQNFRTGLTPDRSLQCGPATYLIQG